MHNTLKALSNYHTHSHYCDGRGELRDFVEYALEHGFSHLGFSGHAPVPFENTFAIAKEDYPKYCAEVKALKEEYAGRIDIKLGLEIDYIPGVLDNFSQLIKEGGLDYFIGSVHLVSDPNGDPNNLWFIDGSKQETYDEGLQRVFGGDVRKGVKAFFHQNNQMLEATNPPIIGHFNKIVMHNRDRYFHENEEWYKNLVKETIALIKEKGTICEINTRGIYKGRHNDFYPSKEIIKYMDSLRIPVLVGSDAHDTFNLDTFCGAYEYLEEIGYHEIVTAL